MLRIVLTQVMDAEHMTAMKKALKAGGVTLELGEGTVIGRVSMNSLEVFRGLRGTTGKWLVRRANGLFAEDGVPDEDAKRIADALKKCGGIGKATTLARI
jgi:hypothetical protein